MPSELLLKIMESCATVSDLSNLSRTSQRLHAVYKRHQRSILASVCDNHFGPLDLAVPMTRHRLGPREDIPTPITHSEIQELVYHDRLVTQQFERTYAENHLIPGTCLTDIQKRRLRSGLYRISIFLDRFQRLHFFPDVKCDFGIPDDDGDDDYNGNGDGDPKDQEPRGTIAQEVPEYAKWLMALSTDELLELEDTRLLIVQVMRNLYPRGYRSDIQTWINRLPYSILQSSLNTMNPMYIAHILQCPEDSDLKDDELNALTEENQAFLDEAIWCTLRLRRRGVKAGYGYLVREEGREAAEVDDMEDFSSGNQVVLLEETLLGMPMEEAYEALIGFLMNADAGVPVVDSGNFDF